MFNIFQEYILNQTGIRNLVGLHSDNIGRGGRTSKTLTENYLKELTPKLLSQLIKMYQIDLDLFGYDPPTYDKS